MKKSNKVKTFLSSKRYVFLLLLFISFLLFAQACDEEKEILQIQNQKIEFENLKTENNDPNIGLATKNIRQLVKGGNYYFVDKKIQSNEYLSLKEMIDDLHFHSKSLTYGSGKQEVFYLNSHKNNYENILNNYIKTNNKNFFYLKEMVEKQNIKPIIDMSGAKRIIDLPKNHFNLIPLKNNNGQIQYTHCSARPILKTNMKIHAFYPKTSSNLISQMILLSDEYFNSDFFKDAKQTLMQTHGYAVVTSTNVSLFPITQIITGDLKYIHDNQDQILVDELLLFELNSRDLLHHISSPKPDLIYQIQYYQYQNHQYYSKLENVKTIDDIVKWSDKYIKVSDDKPIKINDIYYNFFKKSLKEFNTHSDNVDQIVELERKLNKWIAIHKPYYLSSTAYIYNISSDSPDSLAFNKAKYFSKEKIQFGDNKLDICVPHPLHFSGSGGLNPSVIHANELFWQIVDSDLFKEIIKNEHQKTNYVTIDKL